MALRVNGPIKRPKRKITVAEINKGNAVFWAYENLRDKEQLSDEERGLMRGTEAIINREKRLSGLTGTKNSVDARRATVAERNQRWRDAHASGKTPKQIYLDQPKGRGKKTKGRGKKRVSLSTINRVLKGASPP
jgi:hypothetical protein